MIAVRDPEENLGMKRRAVIDLNGTLVEPLKPTTQGIKVSSSSRSSDCP